MQILNKFYAVFLSMLITSLAFCQDKKLDVNINVNKDTQQWYMQPWEWVVGGAVFILLLVALVKGGGKKS